MIIINITNQITIFMVASLPISVTQTTAMTLNPSQVQINRKMWFMLCLEMHNQVGCIGFNNAKCKSSRTILFVVNPDNVYL